MGFRTVGPRTTGAQYTKSYPVRQASEKMLSFLSILAKERVDFGYDPTKGYTMSEAHDLIEAGKRSPRKDSERPNVGVGYYITAEQIVFCVVESKRNPGQTYAKRLIISAVGRASWAYEPMAVKSLVGLSPLTVEKAAELGHAHGVCMVCARTLTDQNSASKGIGPVCAKRLGR